MGKDGKNRKIREVIERVEKHARSINMLTSNLEYLKQRQDRIIAHLGLDTDEHGMVPASPIVLPGSTARMKAQADRLIGARRDGIGNGGHS